MCAFPDTDLSTASSERKEGGELCPSLELWVVWSYWVIFGGDHSSPGGEIWVYSRHNMKDVLVSHMGFRSQVLY